MDKLYVTTYNPVVTNRPLGFNRKNERIDWRRIAAFDVERVARDLDFTALQDNIEHITLCNIDAELDMRSMDPNFVKLYKIAQLIIEYLLICQEQINGQLVDYESIKSKSIADHEDYRRQIQQLKNELNETKKESKKRKKTIETQQKILMNQQPPHFPCPYCGHAFVTGDYLKSHIQRRHGDLDPKNRKEHDVDIEKEFQRLKDELKEKENELQLIKAQKITDDGKIQHRDEIIQQLKEQIQGLTQKSSNFEEKYFTLLATNQAQQPAAPQPQVDSSARSLKRDNKRLEKENDRLQENLRQAESRCQKLEQANQRLGDEKEKLEEKIHELNESLLSFRNATGDQAQMLNELNSLRERYNQEVTRRKKLEEENETLKQQLASHRIQPPSVIERKSPIPTPRTSTSPTPPITTILKRKPTEILLYDHCPLLLKKIRENPDLIQRSRAEARQQYIEEFDQIRGISISESDTRLKDKDFDEKFQHVQSVRQSIQKDLPEFERIRQELSDRLDELIRDREINPKSSIGSARSSVTKQVKFDQQPRPSTIDGKPKTDSNVKPVPSIVHTPSDDEDDRSNTYFNASEEDEQTDPIRPGVKVSPPSRGINGLLVSGMQPKTVNEVKTVRPKSGIHRDESQSDDERPIIPQSMPTSSTTSMATKIKIIDNKLADASRKGQKPTVNAIAQGFQPTKSSLANSSEHDDSEGNSLTSIDDTNPKLKPILHNIVETPLKTSHNNHAHFSEPEVSQYTYESEFKSPTGKGFDFRRPTTADSAKTSMTVSDAESENEED